MLNNKDLMVKIKEGTLPVFNRIEIIRKRGNDFIVISMPFVAKQNNVFFINDNLYFSWHGDNESVENGKLWVIASLGLKNEMLRIPAIIKNSRNEYQILGQLAEIMTRPYDISELEELVRKHGFKITE